MIMASRRLRLVAWLAGVVAILAAISIQSQGQGGERRVVLVNVLDEAGNHVSGLNTANVRGECRGQPVTVLSVTEDTAPRRIAVIVDVSASQEGAALAWRSIAEATGGSTVWVGSSTKENAGEMARTTQAMRVRITSTYRLELGLPFAVDRSREWKLQVADSAGRALRNVHVVYPHRLTPLSSSN